MKKSRSSDFKGKASESESFKYDISIHKREIMTLVIPLQKELTPCNFLIKLVNLDATLCKSC